MKFTLSWLKEHLETDATLSEVADKLTMVGLEVERVEDKAAALAPFTTARVVSAEKHPDADRLRVLKVDAGDGKPVQVVCGAPNARAGLVGVFAKPGTHIPGTGIDLKVGKIRGQESHGMMVSAREMGISDEHDGIIELAADTKLGQPFAPLMGLDDPMIEIAVTPNRADCLGVRGIARDLAAALIGKLKEDRLQPVKGEFPCPVSVKIEDASLCPAFALRLVRGVKNGPSPEWLQRRLRAIGLRPINALVDITNLLTFDRGRPLHVFDAAKVKGNLAVRRANKGDKFLALDGKTYEFDTDACVIADDNGVESLAGIMGGEASGCSDETTDVLIESALWNPINIAQTGRKLGINSDARFRFERGVDPAFTLPGLELATKLVLELCGGKASEVVLAGAIPESSRVIDFPLSEPHRLAGFEAKPNEAKRILTALGFIVSGNTDTVKVAVPSWRGDVEGKADLVEEIVRIAGVDRVPLTPFPRGEFARKPVLTVLQKRTRAAKRALAGCGLVEAVTWSFISKKQAETFGGGAAALALANPIAAELSDMRPSLIPGLALAAQRNADRGYADAALFEVGQIFLGAAPEDQLMAATSLRKGTARLSGSGRHWSGNAGAVNVFDAKADALETLAACGAAVDKLQIVAGGPSYLHPGRSGTIQLGPKNILAYFGELHPAACEALGIEGPVAVSEVILDRIPAPKVKPTRAKPPLTLSPFQPVARDFAFIVDRNVAAADIVRAAQGADKNLVSAVDVFDLYEGKGIETGKKSLAISVTIQPVEKTLTDAEIEAIAAKIVAEVSKKTGATLRS
ncbi:MAG TPA: phenylalanine--tRNA ligase subunit beta [Xanthobacteraceae bacterium]|nr:phenylalanine--tRNA ligase subunit beta [Xanthobacteraceae bacterium]